MKTWIFNSKLQRQHDTEVKKTPLNLNANHLLLLWSSNKTEKLVVLQKNIPRQMHPFLSLSTTQNHQHPFYASEDACILSLSFPSTLEYCSALLQTCQHLLASSPNYNACTKILYLQLIIYYIKIKRIQKRNSTAILLLKFPNQNNCICHVHQKRDCIHCLI